MPKRPGKNQPLEISRMFEPHRHQLRLLREAYAQLLPEVRRCLVSGQERLRMSDAESAVVDGERKSA